MTKMGRCRDLMHRDGEMKWMYSRAHEVVTVVGEKTRSFGKVTVISVIDWMLQVGQICPIVLL
jgi:hypothetical protein